jgi:hypothetical protein
MLHLIESASLRAIINESDDQGVADLWWSDGEGIRVRYDSLVPADETDDGIEACIVDVVTVLVPGRRSRSTLSPDRPGVVRADDPPVRVTRIVEP